MTEPPPIRTELVDGVGWLTLDRPDAMNAITIGLANALRTGLESLAFDANVIVLRGAGANFCVGGDFKHVQALRDRGPGALAELFDAFGAACATIESIDVPVIAAVEGCAMAGGFEMMLASDIVLVSDNAKIADQHTNFAQIPGGGSTQRLARLVGHQRAMSLILTGVRLTPADAVAWGIAHRVVPVDTFEADVAAFATDLADRSRSAAAKIKRLVRDGLGSTLHDGLARERRMVVDHIANDPDAAAAMAEFTARSTTAKPSTKEPT